MTIALTVIACLIGGVLITLVAELLCDAAIRADEEGD